jgi:hypothetical protein
MFTFLLFLYLLFFVAALPDADVRPQSQMLFHSLVPLATYKQDPEAEAEYTRKKPASLFKRMFLGKRSN